MYLVSGHVYAVGTMSGGKAGINWPGDEEEKGETIGYCGKVTKETENRRGTGPDVNLGRLCNR